MAAKASTTATTTGTALSSLAATVLAEAGLAKEVAAALEKRGGEEKRARAAAGSDEAEYERVHEWILACLDAFRDELLPISFALFAHTYVHLVDDGQTARARDFLAKHGMKHHGLAHADEIHALSRYSRGMDAESAALKREHPYVFDLKHKKFRVALSKFSAELLVSTLMEMRLTSALNILNSAVAFHVLKPMPSERLGSAWNRLPETSASFVARAATLVSEAEASADFFTGMDAATRVAVNAEAVQWGVPASARGGLAPATPVSYTHLTLPTTSRG